LGNQKHPTNNHKPSSLKPKRKLKKGKIRNFAQNLMMGFVHIPEMAIPDKEFEWLITFGWKNKKKMKRKNSHTHADGNEKEDVMEPEMNRKSNKEGEKSIIQQPFITKTPHAHSLFL